MKLIHVVFGLLIVIAGLTVFVLMSVPPENAAGFANPAIHGIKMGGDGAARLAPLGNAPFYFQIAVIFLAVGLLSMGVAPRRRTRGFWLFMGAGTLIALLVWGFLYGGYKHYLATGETDFFFGIPVPTAWMLFGVWGSFALLDLFYAFAFRRYFLPEEDEQAFHDLVKELKADGEAK